MKKFGLFTFILWLALAIGYVMCIVRFVQCDFKPSYKAEIIYGIGICSGLGCVIGYIPIADGKETQTSDEK